MYHSNNKVPHPLHTLTHPSHTPPTHTGPPVQRATGHSGGSHPHRENVASAGLVRKRGLPESRQNGVYNFMSVCVQWKNLL